MVSRSGEITYLVIDGENIDATLGMHLLGRRPNADERPRWDRVLDFAAQTWDCEVSGLFFINASSGELPMSFVQALLAIGYRPIPLTGPRSIKVVDVGIQRTLAAIAERDGNVMLGSHDGDFQPQIQALLGDGRKVGVVGFREYLSSTFQELVPAGLEIFDLEDDARSFNIPLPRTRIIEIDDFRPEAFLS